MSGSSAGDSVICPACEAENPAGSRFCERCGTRLPPRQREAESGATLTFQRLPDNFGVPPAAEPKADAPEVAPFERTLIGTPSLGDAAFPGDVPAASVPASDAALSVREEPPVRPDAAPAAEAAATSAQPASPPESPRDRPTMSFQLPDLAPPPSESRSAPTVSFQLPDLTNAAAAPGTAAASNPPPPFPPVAGDPPVAGSAQQGDDWSYQAWRPDPSAGQTAPVADEVGPGGTRRVIDLGAAAPWPTAAPSSGQSSGAMPPGALPPQAPPARRDEAVSPGPPVPYTPAPTPQYPGGPGTPNWPPSGTSPGMAYPGPGMAQVPPAPQYGAPGQLPYPTPSERGNNRALWIILGVVGALLVLCVLGCVVLFLVGAFTGASSSSSFATAVPTITR